MKNEANSIKDYLDKVPEERKSAITNFIKPSLKTFPKLSRKA